MYDLLSVEERELRCYNYFHSNKIETREQLRENLQTNPIQGVRVKFDEEFTLPSGATCLYPKTTGYAEEDI